MTHFNNGRFGQSLALAGSFDRRERARIRRRSLRIRGALVVKIVAGAAISCSLI